MKAIFLDIDGVVATPLSVRVSYRLGRGPERQWYDPFSLCYLGRLVRRTGATVVLASNWRSALEGGLPFEREVMSNLFGQLERFGAPISDWTPIGVAGDRSAEIGAWLDEHPCEAWVILDDMARFASRPEVAEGHLVRIEDSGGIRRRHFRQALSILRRPAGGA